MMTPEERKLLEAKAEALENNTTDDCWDSYSFMKGAEAALELMSEREKKLVEALEPIQCSCSISQRLSGHLVDCWMPEVQEVLAEYKAAKGET